MTKLIRFPKILEEFFQPVGSCFNKCALVHFKTFCILMAASSEHNTVNKIVSLITFGAHRTNCNEFLLSDSWKEEDVLKSLGNRRLKRLYKKISKKRNVAVFSMAALQNQLKTILLQDIFDAFIEKFRILPIAVKAIKKTKSIVFDEKKIYQLAM